MNPEDTLLAAISEAGEVLQSYYGKRQDITYKGGVNLLTEADLSAEKVIIERILSSFPDHSILTEEAGSIRAGSEYCWIIDPLDGTTNFAHGLPIFAVAIAFGKSNTPDPPTSTVTPSRRMDVTPPIRQGLLNLEILIGAVLDPLRQELFFASAGQGAYRNGERISVSGIEELDKSLLATGFPYDIRESDENNLDYFSLFAVRAQAVRRAGAATLDLAYLACGRFDGFWELKLHPWDVAAPSLIISEAGGQLSDFSGAPFSILKQETLASNGRIHSEMLSVINEVRSKRGLGIPGDRVTES